MTKVLTFPSSNELSEIDATLLQLKALTYSLSGVELDTVRRTMVYLAAIKRIADDCQKFSGDFDALEFENFNLAGELTERNDVITKINSSFDSAPYLSFDSTLICVSQRVQSVIDRFQSVSLETDRLHDKVKTLDSVRESRDQLAISLAEVRDSLKRSENQLLEKDNALDSMRYSRDQLSCALSEVSDSLKKSEDKYERFYRKARKLGTLAKNNKAELSVEVIKLKNSVTKLKVLSGSCICLIAAFCVIAVLQHYNVIG